MRIKTRETNPAARMAADHNLMSRKNLFDAIVPGSTRAQVARYPIEGASSPDPRSRKPGIGPYFSDDPCRLNALCGGSHQSHPGHPILDLPGVAGRDGPDVTDLVEQTRRRDHEFRSFGSDKHVVDGSIGGDSAGFR